MAVSSAIAAAFEDQARACAELGSPFTARLCTLAATRLGPAGMIGALVARWPEERLRPDALALRFCGALHALKRRGFAPLESVYPPRQVSDDALWAAVSLAMETEPDFIAGRMQSAPQTNEVRRSAALFPAFAAIAARFPGKEIVLSEIGASAGLNLLWDRYAYRFGETVYPPASGDAPFTIAPEWTGPLPPRAAIAVAERAGCDLNPLDASLESDRERLLSYIWADQDDRLERTQKALALAAATALAVEREDAVHWLEKRLATLRPGKVHIVYHTIAWQYLPFDAQKTGEALLAEAGGRASQDAPLCHLAMEADAERPGAALTLTIWPEGRRQTAGRADFHGRWVNWRGLSS